MKFTETIIANGGRYEATAEWHSNSSKWVFQLHALPSDLDLDNLDQVVAAMHDFKSTVTTMLGRGEA